MRLLLLPAPKPVKPKESIAGLVMQFLWRKPMFLLWDTIRAQAMCAKLAV